MGLDTILEEVLSPDSTGYYPVNSVDKQLLRRIKANHHYPFEKVDEHIYVLEVRVKQFYYSLILLACSVAWLVAMFTTALYPGANGKEAPTYVTVRVGPWVLLGLSFWGLLIYHSKRTYLLHRDKCLVQFYIGDFLVVHTHYHNVYIKLNRCSAADGRQFYKLILGGYLLENVDLCDLSESVEILRFLGKLIAQKLDMNYFDYIDQSLDHVIRHRCPEDSFAIAQKSLLEAYLEERIRNRNTLVRRSRPTVKERKQLYY